VFFYLTRSFVDLFFACQDVQAAVDISVRLIAQENELRFISAEDRVVTMSRKHRSNVKAIERLDPVMILHLDDVSSRLPNRPF
jgi:hypothetical protein